MKNYTLAILGCGNMAQAVLRALQTQTTQDVLRCNDILLHTIVSDIDAAKLATIGEGVRTTTDNAHAVCEADFVLLAVKPQSAPAMLEKLDLRGKVILSIMAGISLATLEALTKSRKLVRVMPNLNARVSRSFNAYACKGIDAQERKFTEILLNAFGVAAEVPEDKLNAVTGLTGSSPAFVFMFVKSFIDSGVSLGFSPAEARKMALEAIAGSVESVKAQPNVDLNDLIDSVCSKGGTTIEGVTYLREHNFESMCGTAIEKAVNRAKELSGEQ